MTMLLVVLLTAFLVCSIVHIGYENIILPLLLKKYKYKLFALRDHLRILQIKYKDSDQKPVFDCLQNTINNTLAFAPSIDGFLLLKFRGEYKKNKELRDAIEKNIDLFNRCSISEIHSIREEMSNIFRAIFISNSGSLIFYILPIFFLLFIIDKISEWTYKSMFMPEGEMGKVAPSCQ
ncbi:MAG: hypothetical protein A2252_06290 [Elusimicrobia bacterium RIFOXYA2_FULL_39_19]|nr:MAG: hypothetical protein A2252_06290 [Elusimicrobia bacterium RIFOXYA2_FULL_39_19]